MEHMASHRDAGLVGCVVLSGGSFFRVCLSMLVAGLV